jgi:hypothetical protein
MNIVSSLKLFSKGLQWKEAHFSVSHYDLTTVNIAISLFLAFTPASECELAHKPLIFLSFNGFFLLINGSADRNSAGYSNYSQEADKTPHIAYSVSWRTKL